VIPHTYTAFTNGFVSAESVPLRTLREGKIQIHIKLNETATIDSIQVVDKETGESLSTGMNDIEAKYIDVGIF
jgi:hypothetical protein